jgi:MFS family permease
VAASSRSDERRGGAVFLNAFAVNLGWRLAFLMGPVLALVVIVVARTLPESPRWLLTHGRLEEAEAELAKIEAVARRGGQELGPVDEGAAITLVPEKQDGYLNAEGKSLEAVTKPLTAADE